MARRDCVAPIVMLFSLVVGCDRSPAAVRSGKATVRPAHGVSRNDPRDVEQIGKDNTFIEAVRDGNLTTAQQLLASGASVNARYIDPYAFLDDGQTGYTALQFASINGNIEMTKLLLAHKVDVNYARKRKSALYFAAIKDHSEVVGLLQEAGATGDPRKIRLTNELIRAACKGFKYGKGEGIPPFPGVVRDLENLPEINDVVKQGADVNWRDPNGYTPLMYAANLGLVANVRTLLAHGADARLNSQDGATALSLAEGETSVNRDERQKVVELLKENLAK